MCCYFIVGFDLAYMNWYYFRICCYPYTYCLQLLVISYTITKIKAIVVITHTVDNGYDRANNSILCICGILPFLN